MGRLDDDKATAGLEVGERGVGEVGGDPVGISEAVREQNDRQVGARFGCGHSQLEVNGTVCRGKHDRAEGQDGCGIGDGDLGGSADLGVVIGNHDDGCL